jgi:hypothetical protein
MYKTPAKRIERFGIYLKTRRKGLLSYRGWFVVSFWIPRQTSWDFLKAPVMSNRIIKTL